MAVVAEETGGFGVSPGFDPGMASHLSLGDGLGRGLSTIWLVEVPTSCGVASQPEVCLTVLLF